MLSKEILYYLFIYIIILFYFIIVSSYCLNVIKSCRRSYRIYTQWFFFVNMCINRMLVKQETRDVFLISYFARFRFLHSFSTCCIISEVTDPEDQKLLSGRWWKFVFDTHVIAVFAKAQKWPSEIEPSALHGDDGSRRWSTLRFGWLTVLSGSQLGVSGRVEGNGSCHTKEKE